MGELLDGPVRELAGAVRNLEISAEQLTKSFLPTNAIGLVINCSELNNPLAFSFRKWRGLTRRIKLQVTRN
jgi:hypothetical protein